MSNRGRDFAEIIRVQGGFGRGLGVTVRAVGVLDIGLNTPGQFPHSSGLGLVYGDPYFLGGRLSETDFMRGFHDEVIGLDPETREYLQVHKCWGVLPALFSRVDKIKGPDYPCSDDHVDWIEGPMIWSHEALAENPWAHVHAFDAELGVFLLLVNAHAGLSPGETADFLLGIFGIDIACDDNGRIEPSTTRPEHANERPLDGDGR